ncbi:hypothetical protein Ssi03_43220 [Sphaerisporangium siamense]|uniref:Putative membrane protein (TIGR02234 family) n=1 Tax=Sphaerisporangium siamense TaxID=795645 RepID=A0A7W7DDU9_9ACTN|nr:TIGR02234 family membrane protein [Sphaerisporangium siamense]MBB4704719.1 putative membrane protein (TIGR02234 family) [Sphaerisporangium siamense]GII86332.1 hypothetical protein Ssi03_43220 [Sphaerisporangium siamense]
MSPANSGGPAATAAVPAPGPPRSARRALLAWLALAVAGAVLTLAASGRTWATVALGAGPAGGRAAPVPLSGSDIAPVLSPLALAALAAAVAVLATRGAWRAVVGAVIALIGLAVAGSALRGVTPSSRLVALAEEHTSVTGAAAHAAVAYSWAWPVAAVAGGALLLAAGVLAVARGARWPGMSDRYERPGGSTARPAERAGQAERSLWDALDQGVDPTEGEPGERDGGRG